MAYYNSNALISQSRRAASAPQQARGSSRASQQSVQLAPTAQGQDFEPQLQAYGQQSRSSNSRHRAHVSRSRFPTMPALQTPVVVHDGSMLKDFQNDFADGSLDLGVDGAFSEFSVLFGAFYDGRVYGEGTLLPALEKKGFQVTWVTEETEFIKKVLESNAAANGDGRYDVIGFTSNSSFPGDEKAFTSCLLEANKQGSGLFIFADNQPYTYHANLILPELANCIVTGDDRGGQNLVYGDPSEAGRFSPEHLVFAGINNLYEGITICYPVPVDGGEGKDQPECKLSTIATSTFDRPVISVIDSDVEGHARVLVDTGFTKLSSHNWGGQERYVVNACVWLTDIERRYGKQEPVGDKGLPAYSP